MTTWFNNLSLRYKFFIIFSILIGIIILLTITAIANQNNAQITLQSVFDQVNNDIQLEKLSTDSKESLLKADRISQKYILNYKTVGFAQAHVQYITSFQNEISFIQQNIEDIKNFSDNSATVALVNNINEAIIEYHIDFLTLVNLYEQRGYIDDGLEGAFREKTHRIEAFVANNNLEQLTIDNLIMRRHEKNYLLHGEEIYVEQVHQAVATLKTNITLTELPQTEQDELVQLADEYQAYFDRLVAIDNEIKGALVDFREHTEFIAPLFNDIVVTTEVKREINSNDIQQEIEARSLFIISWGVIAIVISVISAFFLSTRITSAVDKVAQAAKRISLGQIDKVLAVTSGDELGSMATAFNQMIAYQKQITNVANQLAQGDLTVNFVSVSEADVLGQALEQMLINLKESSTATKNQIWHATGQTELNNQLRGETDTPALAKEVIRHLCQYLDLQIGVLYLFEDNLLKLVGSYAYTYRKTLVNQFEVGQGVIGQALLEKQSLVITKVPEDYLKVTSGLGESRPQQILVAPFLYQNKVIGVIELGTLDQFTEIQLDFIKAALDNIAIAFNTALSRNQINFLLAQSQQQTEELQTQSEELRVLNEELQSQTESLRESEEQLKKQQIALEATNVELEEKATRLEETTLSLREKQKAIDEQNHALQITKQTLEQKAKALTQASKYKSEFLANMSHELRTPLNSLLILSHLLMENSEGNLSAKEVEQVNVIYNSGNDLLNLINEILDLAKIESGKIVLEMTEVSLHDLSKALQNQFNPIAQKQGVTWEVILNPDVPKTIHTDQQRLQQILKNFLSNAFKFTETGTVRLKIYCPDNQVDLSESGLDDSQTVAISVQDSGIGITSDQQKFIFEAFQQADGSTSRKYGGTGLGLSISKQLATTLGGEITLESEMGHGSTFTLYLPLLLTSNPAIDDLHPGDASETNLPSPLPQTQTKPSSFTPPVAPYRPPENQPVPPHPVISDDRDNLHEGEIVILVIEDDARFAQILLDLAHTKGFKCLIAQDGKIGLDMVHVYTPTAIVLDLNLPKMNGWEILNMLKKDAMTRHIPVHIVSVEDEKHHALQQGAIGYAIKPVSQIDLENIFQQVERFKMTHIKSLLLIEDDENLRYSMVELLGGRDLQITQASTGQTALNFLEKQLYDCIILDMNLPDMNGLHLLEQVVDKKKIADCPIIVYTGQVLSQEENLALMKYTDHIIIKSVKSLERLLDETNLFLHRVITKVATGNQSIIQNFSGKENILKNKHILIVDDDMRNSFALSKLLTAKDIVVDIASNGQKALEFLAKTPDIDLVLMDIMMPVMDGFETIKHIRQQAKLNGLPILALTAKAMKEDREKCLAAGANDYLPKPIDPNKLFAMLKIWLYEKAKES